MTRNLGTLSCRIYDCADEAVLQMANYENACVFEEEVGGEISIWFEVQKMANRRRKEWATHVIVNRDDYIALLELATSRCTCGVQDRSFLLQPAPVNQLCPGRRYL